MKSLLFYIEEINVFICATRGASATDVGAARSRTCEFTYMVPSSTLFII